MPTVTSTKSKGLLSHTTLQVYSLNSGRLKVSKQIF